MGMEPSPVPQPNSKGPPPKENWPFPLEKPNRKQLFSPVVGGTHNPLPLHARMLSELIMCRWSEQLWAHARSCPPSYIPRRHHFSLVKPALWLLHKSFWPSVWASEGKGCDIDISFMNEHPQKAYSLYYGQFCVSRLTTVHCTVEALWKELRGVLITCQEKQFREQFDTMFM